MTRYRRNVRLALAGCAVCLVFAQVASGQAVRAVPYNAQLRTDPDVGNVQGIQRYGRPLKTDPDQGEGYGYYVYPVSYPDKVVVGAAETRVPTASPSALRLQLEADEITRLKADLGKARAAGDEVGARELEGRISDNLADLLQRITSEPQAEAVGASGATTSFAAAVETVPGFGPASPYPPPFDATAGIRSWGPPDAPRVLPEELIEGAYTPYAEAVVKSVQDGAIVTGIGEIYNQPLIQVRMRVVEVFRNDDLQAQSVLDYVSTLTGGTSLIQTNTLTPGKVGQEVATRFPLTNPLLGISGTTLSGTTGGLVNLTSKHLNWVASLLAREFSADVITAPEVVTLNGQNVEFVAGSKVPFDLGQNVTTGATINIQQFFYKSVGTFVSVTPRIVNWGLHGEGEGKAPLAEAEILDWNALIHWMLVKPEIAARIKALETDDFKRRFGEVSQYRTAGSLVPINVRTELLQILKAYPRAELAADVNDFFESPIIGLRVDCDRCSWKPEDCTIDLSLVVRLSTADTVPRQTISSGSTATEDVTIEKDVRAIANVVQVKSGHGAVIGGLIGAKDIEEVAKIPVLGDVPVLGAAFRAKTTTRQKTELLVFVEARVLDPRPEAARCESAEDFAFSQPYVWGDFLDNPLEYGMYRAGFGAYLPPCSHEERIFWERLGRKVRKASTEIDDIFE